MADAFFASPDGRVKGYGQPCRHSPFSKRRQRTVAGFLVVFCFLTVSWVRETQREPPGGWRKAKFHSDGLHIVLAAAWSTDGLVNEGMNGRHYHGGFSEESRNPAFDSWETGGPNSYVKAGATALLQEDAAPYGGTMDKYDEARESIIPSTDLAFNRLQQIAQETADMEVDDSVDARHHDMPIYPLEAGERLGKTEDPHHERPEHLFPWVGWTYLSRSAVR